MLNPWIILGIALAWLGSLAGVGYWQHQDGVTVATAACQKKQLEVDKQSAVLLAAKSAKILEGETQHATDQNTINSLAAESGSVSVHIPIPPPAAVETPKAAPIRTEPTDYFQSEWMQLLNTFKKELNSASSTAVPN